ncbi:hypothetical protein GQ53DRAFT_748206 [Thozetella sp. PMI_491]|nr:hypothetical protein GQ53DRAFT_748206 [Thozetella sp. PMI_491]
MALASIGDIAEISLTTRVAGEPVATMVTLISREGAEKRQHTSGLCSLDSLSLRPRHIVPATVSCLRVEGPMGTTVNVGGLFSKTPVRRRLFEKEAGKSLANIRTLVQSYALARRNIRLSFKVSKNAKMSWQYASKRETDLREAVLLVFGSSLVSQCIISHFPRTENQGEGHDGTILGARRRFHGQHIFEFEACIPKIDANSSIISKGCFVSIDSRPVSSSRGTTKKLMGLFRAHFNRVARTSDCSEAARNPFISLNIICPPGSYDVNIEPSKDDVCFAREQDLVSQFESFLHQGYPPATLTQQIPEAGANLQPVSS